MVPLLDRGSPKGDKHKQFLFATGVPYNEFDKWFKKTHRSVAPVEVTGIPEVETPTDGNIIEYPL